LPEEQSIHCPLCGKKVPSDVDKCPFCSTHIDKVMLKREVDKVIERRLMRKIRASADEAPAAPVPTAPIPEVKVTCPGCGLELKGGEAKCSRCGIPLAGEDDLLECPDCGARFAPGAKACPKCGVSFVEEAAVALPEPVPEPSVEALRPETREVSPAEVVTALPAEPVSVGRGLTNGRGAINGTGLVNGTGMINGTKGESRQPSPARRRGFAVARWQFLAVLVALVIIIPTFIYISYSNDGAPYSVDGDFGEWASSDSYSMDILTTMPITVIDEWSVAVDSTRVYLYVSAEGNMFDTISVESLFLFVDSDGDQDTGYAIGTMGADFMVELDGWNGSVESTDVCAYDPDDADERYDWNSWESLGGVANRLDEGQLEAMGNLQVTPSADARFMLLSQDQLARRSVSASVPDEGGALIVRQSLSPSVPVSGILAESDSEAILTLEFTCDGMDGTVDSVDVQLENLSPIVSEFEPFTLSPGEVKTVDFEVDTSSLSPGQFVSAQVSSEDIGSSFASVDVLGQPARAYVGSVPSSVSIDGAFGDWADRTVSDVDPLEVLNDNIDVQHVGVFNTSASSSFFISVAGEMCSGSYVPVMRGKPVPGDGGAVVPAARKTAEDITRIFIDSDMSSATGYPVSVDSKVIGADYRIEVRGLNGEVVSSVLHVYSGVSWAVASTELDVEVDWQRMEVGVPSYEIGGAVAIDFIIETTDWRQYNDYVALDEATMLALTGGMSSSVGTLSWAVDTTTSSDEATSSSYQRKLFYDGTNFWSFYFDGSDTVYKYSSNGGVTWTFGDQVFTIGDVGKVSLWYDSDTNVVYVIGDRTSTLSELVYVRRGTVTESPASITWGSQVAFDISTTNYPLADKNTYITKDVNGAVWVAVVTRVHATQEQYNIRTASTASGDDITGSWTDRGNLIAPSMDDPNGRATLLPGNPSDGVVAWAVYTYHGGVYSRVHSGSGWGTEREIHEPSTGTNADNTIYAPPSAVVDSNHVVHVVYGTSNMNVGSWYPDIHYVYNTSTSAWSSPRTMDSSASGILVKSPTISLDSSTGNVYVMWLKDEASADSIEVEKNVSGTWSSVSPSQTTYVKAFLTSIYSAPGEAYICWQWTQNTSSPDVIFDKIPEFSDAVVPVLFVLTIFIAVYRRRSRPEELS